MTTSFYSCELLLLDKTIGTPTPINLGKVVNGDLNTFKGRLELVHTGNSKTDNGAVTLRVPSDGTFIRKEPILINEEAKDKYIIQAQLKQPDGAGGTIDGKLFRFTLGIPTIQDDVGSGETLKIQLIAIEYRIKEHLTSKQLKLKTPRDAFEQRLADYNSTKGSSAPAVLFSASNPDPDNDSIQLPYDESLKQDWNPFGAVKTHDLLREIIERLSLPSTSGGTFQDYFFDFEANPADINIINASAGEFGGIDSLVIINPLSVNAPETEKDKTITSDFTEWKNNIIFEGGSTGSLPVERSKFDSYWQHAQARPLYSASDLYYNDSDPSRPQSFIKATGTTFLGKEVTRFFKYVHTVNGVTAPSPFASGQTTWFEDFTVIPPFNSNAQYEEGEIVYIDAGGQIDFYELNTGETHVPTDTSPDLNANWLVSFPSIPTARHTAFFSYTPWTSDYVLQKSMLSDVVSPYQTETYSSGGTVYTYGDKVVHLGVTYACIGVSTSGAFNPLMWSTLDTYLQAHKPDKWMGVVPDWNLEICNFDRVVSNDQFEQISQKAVARAVTSSASITTAEKVNGARFLINGTGSGDFAGHNNQIAEWYDPLGVVGSWQFSKTPSTDHELVTNLETGQLFKWNGTTWSVCWDPKQDNAGNSSPFHAVFDTQIGETDVRDKMGFGLVTGATGIPAQAIRLKYNWDNVNEGKLNLTSRGAWWCMHFPFPKLAIDSRTIGDTYSNSTFDATNLDVNRLGQLGWNNGLDSEDLGRISELTMKVRLTIKNKDHQLITGYANMPARFWAIDVFGRIWYQDVVLRKNGEYNRIHINFGGNTKNIYRSRIDELFEVFGLTLSQNFFLKEKEFTGIEFDWRFVKSFGLAWKVSYDDNGMYVGVRDSFMNILSSWTSQVVNYTLSGITHGGIPPEELVIDNATLDIDELAFSKQLIANSDDTAVADARTEVFADQNEVDYLNAKNRAKAKRARKKFINQAWHLKAQGDVRMDLGKRFTVTGSRVPEQITNYSTWSSLTSYVIGDKVSYLGSVWQAIRAGSNIDPVFSPSTLLYWKNLNEMVCAQVTHIIDSDGYTMDVLGVRKFVYQ